jgi:hypothetical protein
MHAKVQQALEFSIAYMRYVQQANPKLHKEADGIPSILQTAMAALSGEGRK